MRLSPSTVLAGAVAAALICASAGHADDARGAALLDTLVEAYPDHLAGHDGANLLWKDGTRMPFDDGRRDKSFDQLLDEADIEDQFHWPYPRGQTAGPPGFNVDPGRARNTAFFTKMYGDCRKGEVARNLVEIVWLPGHGAARIKATRVNGVAERLKDVSAALDALPKELIKYLKPTAGIYNCRAIAGTNRPSVHGFGAAIDINVKFANYWRWTKPGADGRYPYRNQVPRAVIEIFEAHGFIWGGKWYHYDTMHFEYRPELLRAAR